MTPYLFLWNPKVDTDSFDDYESIIEDAENGFPYGRIWNCPSKQPLPGDIAIVQRTGIKNNGIFAKGIVTQPFFEDDDGTRVIGFELDSFLPIGMEIPRKEIIEAANYAKNWQPMASGNVIPEPLFNAIISIWDKRTSSAEINRASDIESDILEILAIESKTERETLINARIGQGKYRDELMKIWRNKCAITGCTQSELLRASHSKPWKLCNNSERLDPNNGILLCANYDAAFDTGLITISAEGKVITSKELNASAKQLLSIPENLTIKINNEQKRYLEFHRNNIFRL